MIKIIEFHAWNEPCLTDEGMKVQGHTATLWHQVDWDRISLPKQAVGDSLCAWSLLRSHCSNPRSQRLATVLRGFFNCERQVTTSHLKRGRRSVCESIAAASCAVALSLTSCCPHWWSLLVVLLRPLPQTLLWPQH